MHDHEPAQIVLDGSFTQSKSVHSLRLSLDCTENRKSLRLTFFLRVLFTGPANTNINKC